MAPKIVVALLLAFSIAGMAPAQDNHAKQTPAAQQGAAQQPIPKNMAAFGVSEDTPVRLRLTRNISSATEKVNDKVDFEVIEDVRVRDLVVIPHGAVAIATVTEAQPKRRMGKAGKLNVNIDYVQLPTGDKVALRAVKGGNGGGHTGAMTGAMIATGIVFFPAAPLFLFMHGKDINIPKGTEVTAYVAADTPLDQSKFNGAAPPDAIPVTQPASAQLAPAASTTAAAADPNASPVVITSEPDGADIIIDGKYVGATASTIQLTPGNHAVEVEKSGYKKWSRALTVIAGGSVTVKATLEKQQ